MFPPFLLFACPPLKPHPQKDLDAALRAIRHDLDINRYHSHVHEQDPHNIAKEQTFMTSLYRLDQEIEVAAAPANAAAQKLSDLRRMGSGCTRRVPALRTTIVDSD